MNEPGGWNLAPRLAGRIVTLEPLAAEHYEGMFAVARPEEIWTWWPFNPGTDKTAFREWFDTALSDPERGDAWHFATLDAGTGTPIGSTSFCTARPDDRGVEIGWTWVTPSAWGTGANTEAKLLQLTYAFETLGCIRVEFDTDEKNARSRRALQALPATFEGVFRDLRIIPSGEIRSSAYYSILEREWPVVKKNLERRIYRHG
jgi:N-acetyltransferase